MENDMTLQHTDEDPIYFDHYDSEALHEILDTQHKNKQLNTPRRTILGYYFRYWLSVMISPMIRASQDSRRCCARSMSGGVVTWCVKGERLVSYESERCDDYDAVDPVSLLIEDARQVLINSKGPCDKSFAKTDRDLHAWLTSWLPPYEPSGPCWQ